MSATNLITTDGGLFTSHDMFGAFIVGGFVALLVAGIVVAFCLSHAVSRDIDQATTLPAPPLADDATTRITEAPVIDLPRRSTRTWSL